MKKYILLFPGQGSQYVGMDKIPKKILGVEFVDAIWEKVNAELGYDLKDIVQNGPQNILTLTQNAQPALVTTSYLFMEILKKHFGLSWKEHIDCVLGHSLGEYSALMAAGTLSLNDAVKITHLRGVYMQEAVAPGVGAMYAILKCPKNLVQQACATVSTDESLVSIANDNSLDQVVISGNAVACQQAIKWLEENCTEKFRAMPLQVSAPFHSPLMKPAATKLVAAFSKIHWKENEIDYISNVDAERNLKNTTIGIIQNKLMMQVCGTVKWVDSINQLNPELTCLEVGPSMVLIGLVKKIKAQINCMAIDQDKELSELEK